jgi:FKBP-type peptidyl-prolyl cis-trans isomerase 2
MTLQKKDFIEIDFTGKTKDGDVFDSNEKAELEKLGSEIEAKSFTYCLGENMFLEAVDNFLIGKDIGKHKIELKPGEAFGEREAKLIKMIPRKVFTQHQINPIQGAMLNFDGRMGKVLSVSGGRVLIDFNHPLSGKEIIYYINIKRKVEDTSEKIKSMNDFLFKKDLNFEIKDNKLIMQVEKALTKFVEVFKDKFKEIFNLDLEVREISEEIKKIEDKR